MAWPQNHYNSMRGSSLLILRIGLAVTFIWIGVLILQNPESWATGFIKPWAQNLMPFQLVDLMRGTAVLDIAVGILLLIRRYAWIGGVIGSLHILGVLIVSGVNSITVRDIGLLSATVAITISTVPEYLARRLPGSEISTVNRLSVAQNNDKPRAGKVLQLSSIHNFKSKFYYRVV